MLKGRVKSNTLAAVLTAILPAVMGIGGGIVMKSIKTLKEVGEFFVALGTVFEDGKPSGKELKNIFKKGRDVFNIRKKTQSQFNLHKMK